MAICSLMAEKAMMKIAAAVGMVMDMGTVLDGRQAVEEGLIDELGGLRDALGYLYKEIEK